MAVELYGFYAAPVSYHHRGPPRLRVTNDSCFSREADIWLWGGKIPTFYISNNETRVRTCILDNSVQLLLSSFSDLVASKQFSHHLDQRFLIRLL